MLDDNDDDDDDDGDESSLMIMMIMMIVASAGCSSFLKTITESAAAQMRLQWSSARAARTKRN